MLINQAEIHGESGTGFEKYAHKGPFECGNCHYFDNGTCHQKTMIAKSKQPHANGGVTVDAKDCCEYVDRVGKSGSLTAAARRKHGI